MSHATVRPSPPPAPLGPAPLPRYTVFYDANCRLCARSRRTLARLRPRAELTFIDVQDDAAMRQFPAVDRTASLGQMFVVDPAGQVSGGYDAFLSLAAAVPLLRPFRRFLAWAPVRCFGWKAYRWVARNRYRLGGAVSCDGGTCRLD